MSKVSVIVVTYNNERIINQCLESVINQSYSNLELIVIDNGSTDSTFHVASKYATKLLVAEKNVVGNSRQIGVENAEGEILFFLDSDSYLPSPEYLFNAVSKFKDKVGVVELDNKPPQKASMTAICYFNLRNVLFNYRIKKGKGPLAGGNALFLKEAVEKAGGFDRQLHFGDDNDLGNRVARLGYKLAFYDEPIIHDTMFSMKEFTRKQLWGARALSTTGFTPLGLDLKDAFFEQIIIGLWGMIKGLACDKDNSWMIFPLLLSIRTIIYASVFVISTILSKFRIDFERFVGNRTTDTNNREP